MLHRLHSGACVSHLHLFCFLNVGVILYAHINEAVGSRLSKVCSSRVSVGLLEPVYQRESLPLRFIATFVHQIHNLSKGLDLYIPHYPRL